ncbi:MAG: hypothetical protein AB1400_05850 [Pseudomonadota bacterium]
MNDFIKKALPWIGAAATGNVPALVGMAAAAIGNAVGTPVEANQKAIEAAVTTATPEQVDALKQADADFALKMKALGIAHIEELERVAAGDRADARQREIKTGDSWTPRILAAVVVIGYLAVQWFVLSHIVAQEMREIVLRSMGTLDMALGLVLGYYFGSSSGSRENQEALRGAIR